MAAPDLKQNSPRLAARGPSGGLFWIDQEVVTLGGPFGNFRVPAKVAGRINPNSPLVVRWFFTPAPRKTDAPQAPKPERPLYVSATSPGLRQLQQ
jgi:hypothetical protein